MCFFHYLVYPLTQPLNRDRVVNLGLMQVHCQWCNCYEVVMQCRTQFYFAWGSSKTHCSLIWSYCILYIHNSYYVTQFLWLPCYCTLTPFQQGIVLYGILPGQADVQQSVSLWKNTCWSLQAATPPPKHSMFSAVGPSIVNDNDDYCRRFTHTYVF